MILDIDIGNTRVKWRETSEANRLSISSAVPASDINHDLQLHLTQRPRRVRISNVRGVLIDSQLTAWCERHFGLAPEFARSTAVAAGVTNGYKDPNLLGVDRWLAILESYRIAQGAVVVLDFGTAITADAVDPLGRHVGGFIGPGIRLMTGSLRSNTSLVRFTDLQHQKIVPGQNTETAVAGGVLAAAVGFAKEAWDVLSHKTGAKSALLTGGDASTVAQQLEFPLQIAPDLVLDGLAVAMP